MGNFATQQRSSPQQQDSPVDENPFGNSSNLPQRIRALLVDAGFCQIWPPVVRKHGFVKAKAFLGSTLPTAYNPAPPLTMAFQVHKYKISPDTNQMAIVLQAKSIQHAESLLQVLKKLEDVRLDDFSNDPKFQCRPVGEDSVELVLIPRLAKYTVFEADLAPALEVTFRFAHDTSTIMGEPLLAVLGGLVLAATFDTAQHESKTWKLMHQMACAVHAEFDMSITPRGSGWVQNLLLDLEKGNLANKAVEEKLLLLRDFIGSVAIEDVFTYCRYVGKDIQGMPDNSPDRKLIQLARAFVDVLEEALPCCLGIASASLSIMQKPSPIYLELKNISGILPLQIIYRPLKVMLSCASAEQAEGTAGLMSVGCFEHKGENAREDASGNHPSHAHADSYQCHHVSVTSLHKLYRSLTEMRKKQFVEPPTDFDAVRKCLKSTCFSEPDIRSLQAAMCEFRGQTSRTGQIGISRAALAEAQEAIRRSAVDINLQSNRKVIASSQLETLEHALARLLQCLNLVFTSEDEISAKISLIDEEIFALESSLRHAQSSSIQHLRTLGEDALNNPSTVARQASQSLTDEIDSALIAFDVWNLAVPETSQIACTDRAMEAAKKAITETALNMGVNDEALKSLEAQLNRAWTAALFEHDIWLFPYDLFPYQNLLTAGAKALEMLHQAATELRLVRETLSELQVEIEELKLIAHPESTRDPARHEFQAAMQVNRDSRYHLEDAVIGLKRARERGDDLKDLDQNIESARLALQKADLRVRQGVESLARLSHYFPEIMSGVHGCIPRKLLPLWSPTRTLAYFVERTLLPAHSRNRVYRVNIDGGSFALKEFPIATDGLLTCWREASVLHRAQHPHIVQLCAVFEDLDAKAFYLQFPYYEHGQLDTWISTERPNKTAVQRVLYEVLQALAHLHGLSIIHADVKPANILIGGDGRARLADFDISVDSGTRTCVDYVRKTNTFVGYTHGFAAPELLQTGASAETDMFAYGATVEFAMEPGVEHCREFVSQLQHKTPASRLLADKAMNHVFFTGLFSWYRDECFNCTVMASESCAHGSKTLRLSDGLLCSGTCAHFICNDCLDQHVSHLANTNGRVRREREGRVYCPLYPSDCNGPPFLDAALARTISPKTFGMYITGRLALLEEQKAQELEAQMKQRISNELRRLNELDEEQRKIRTAIHHIEEEILTLKCPRSSCRQAFHSFDGCFALKCSRCSCAFRGWCLLDCGSDAHPHVRTCTHKPPGADLFFGSFEDFGRAMRRRQKQMLQSHLKTLAGPVRTAVERSMSVAIQELDS